MRGGVFQVRSLRRARSARCRVCRLLRARALRRARRRKRSCGLDVGLIGPPKRAGSSLGFLSTKHTHTHPHTHPHTHTPTHAHTHIERQWVASRKSHPDMPKTQAGTFRASIGVGSALVKIWKPGGQPKELVEAFIQAMGSGLQH